MPSAGPDHAHIERFRRDFQRVAKAFRLVTRHPGENGDASPELIAATETGLVGIALSGGPDSLALLLLAGAAFPGRVRAMTVDHGLRSEAAAEAKVAAAACAGLDVPHEIERVSVPKAREGLQAAARDARYDALADWAARHGLGTLLTAHHADDQAETLLMRLARGAGLAGLAGIRAARGLPNGIPLLRPLLGWRKAELEDIVAAAGLIPARDPSNDDHRFDRTAARRLVSATDWIEPLRLAASAAHLADAEAALCWATARAYAETVVEEDGAIVVSPDCPREIVRRLVLRLFADRFDKHPDGPGVERAMDALLRGETVTLADVVCRPDGRTWRFRPAPARRSSGRSL